MVVSKRSPERGQGYSRDFSTGEWEGASYVVHAETPAAYNDVKIKERGGKIENRSRCSFTL